MNFTDRTLADKGLISYRAKGNFCWIMIGAKDDNGALREAQRSTDKPITLADLQIWDGEKYRPVL